MYPIGYCNPLCYLYYLSVPSYTSSTPFHATSGISDTKLGLNVTMLSAGLCVGISALKLAPVTVPSALISGALIYAGGYGLLTDD